MDAASSSSSPAPCLTISRDALLFGENLYDDTSGTEVESQEYIGKGGFGRVYRAIWKRPEHPDQQVVVKVIDIEQVIIRQNFMREARMLARQSQSKPQAIRLYGTSSTETKCYIVMEYMPNGDLEQFYQSSAYEHMSWPQRFRLFSSIAKVVADLHDTGLVHCDIKPDNFLMHQEAKGDEWDVKICDLGLAKSLREASNTTPSIGNKRRGVPGYLAPEYLSMAAHTYTTAMDVFSLGMTIWSVVFKTMPFSIYTRSAVIDFVCGDGSKPGRRAPTNWSSIPELWRSHIQRLICACWADDPQQRPSARQVGIWLQKAQQQGSVEEAVEDLFKVLHSNWDRCKSTLRAFMDKDLPLTSYPCKSCDGADGVCREQNGSSR